MEIRAKIHEVADVVAVHNLFYVSDMVCHIKYENSVRKLNNLF
jgi:hypothetical protein